MAEIMLSGGSISGTKAGVELVLDAEVDPVHGKDWMDKAIVPTVAELPHWGPRIVKGAWWRSVLNLRFFEAVRVQLVEVQAAA